MASRAHEVDEDDEGTARPGVSVVVAALDAERTLGAQLEALARQEAPLTWEVVVADNGSTDGTRAVVDAMSGRVGDLRWVDASARRGAGAARNVGAEAARGELLLFCDADDMVAPGWLAAMAAAVRAERLVGGRLEWERLNDARARRSRALPQTEHLQVSEPMTGLAHASASNLGVEAALFHELGGFDADALFLQDTDLCWRAQLAGTRLHFAPDAVVHMRLRRTLRSAWRQGRNSGMGQRWLAARYSALAPAAHEGRAVAGTGATPVAGRPRHRRVARVLRRLRIVAGDVLRARNGGDVAALAWSTGFGAGYARGGIPEPEPLSRDRAAAGRR